jgi:elongation factor Ts
MNDTQLIKMLREQSGAGMMDCKKALEATSYNLEDAVDWLRKKGLAAAAKKSGRTASEGLVVVAASADGKKAAVVEMNAETDFVARNPQFQEMVTKIGQTALQAKSLEALAAAQLDGQTVEATVQSMIAVIGENMMLRRMENLEVSSGVVASYMHSAVEAGLGRIGVLVALESTAPQDALLELGKKIAMHVAAAAPRSLVVADLNPADIERERSVLIEQAKASGRPDEVIQKMVEGRLRKFYEEVVLTEQTYVVDGKTRIADVIAEASKSLGAPVTLKAFARFQLGEGIEKEASDFAAEVAAQAGVCSAKTCSA